jgi:hypothetical protein
MQQSVGLRVRQDEWQVRLPPVAHLCVHIACDHPHPFGQKGADAAMTMNLSMSSMKVATGICSRMPWLASCAIAAPPRARGWPLFAVSDKFRSTHAHACAGIR